MWKPVRSENDRIRSHKSPLTCREVGTQIPNAEVKLRLQLCRTPAETNYREIAIMIEYTLQHESAYYHPVYITDPDTHLRQIQMYSWETKRPVTLGLRNTKISLFVKFSLKRKCFEYKVVGKKVKLSLCLTN
jgi:hypothetical protein